MFKASSQLVPQNLFTAHAASFNLSEDDYMQLNRVIADKYGYTHHYFYQFYKQVRVVDGHYAIHAHNGYAQTGKGDLITGLDMSVEPSLEESTALAFALNTVNAPTYKWQVAAEEQLLKEMTQDTTATYYPVGKLGIIAHEADSEDFRLVYAFHIHTLLEGLLVMVDANTGEIIRLHTTDKYAKPHSTDDECQSIAQLANTAFYGPQTVYAIPQDDGTFLLKKDCIDRDECHILPIENAVDVIAINHWGNSDYFALRLAEHYLSESNYAAALAQISNLPNPNAYAQCLAWYAGNYTASNLSSGQLSALCNSSDPYGRLVGNSLSLPPGDSLSYEHPIRKLSESSGKTAYVPLEKDLHPCLTLSPNPANNFISVQSHCDHPTQLTIYNSMGQRVKTLPIRAQRHVAEINVSDWAVGVYLYQVSQNEAVMQSGKLIINK